MPIRTEPGRRPQPQTVLAAALLLVGFLLLWSALAADGDFGLRGPRLAPVVVTSAWVAAAAVLLFQRLRLSRDSATPEPPTSSDKTDIAESADGVGEERAGAGGVGVGTVGAGGVGVGTVGAGGVGSGTVGAGSTTAPLGVLAALAGFAIALEYAGFVVSAALFTVVTARILGSRHLVRDVIVAIVLPVVVYLAFTRLLDIFLPAGVFPL
ncbi:MAG: tripartite tricarboxylate transporter TctB family protein [Actinomycetota bacterium]|nr:tripartite tricarboxylate transporter TctB family protein [Actinomycetota bacterium]